MTRLVNLIYYDETRDPFMTERYEGVLLESGTYKLNRCEIHIQQVGSDRVYTSGQHIIEICRDFIRTDTGTTPEDSG